MTRLDYLNNQYENLLGWYKLAEEKSKFLVTINTLVAGVMNGVVFVASDKLATVIAVYPRLVSSLLLLSGISLIGSFILILRAVWARHRGPKPDLKDTEKLWFFGDIASMTRQKHEALMQHWSEEQLNATMIAQNHILSGSVRTKFDALNWAISLTIAALILLVGLGVAYSCAVTNIPTQR